MDKILLYVKSRDIRTYNNNINKCTQDWFIVWIMFSTPDEMTCKLLKHINHPTPFYNEHFRMQNESQLVN